MPNIHDQRNKQGQGKWLQCTIVSQFMRISLEQTILPNLILAKKRITIWFGAIKTFLAQKVLHEKLTKFTKIVKYICIKTSRIAFAAKISRYSRYRHCLQNEWTSFSLGYWNILVWRYQNHFVHKTSTSNVIEI